MEHPGRRHTRAHTQ
ncbi:hypothetical protein CGCSCA1_v004099 [Colletotrichum siamense]|nr:hypothetical protein CGCSCA1_v004099 [Colletotrichum siamense]